MNAPQRINHRHTVRVTFVICLIFEIVGTYKKMTQQCLNISPTAQSSFLGLGVCTDTAIIISMRLPISASRYENLLDLYLRFVEKLLENSVGQFLR